ncbi:MAG: ATP-grasp domain-containing protein [Candidatus Woesearchaeota archaeon]
MKTSSGQIYSKESSVKQRKNREAVIQPKKNTMLVIVATTLDDDDFYAIEHSLPWEHHCLYIIDTATAQDLHTQKENRIIDEFLSTDDLLEKVKRWHQQKKVEVVGVLGFDEEHHYRFSAAIAKHFKVSYHCQKTLDCCSNKYLQRLLLQKHQIPVPKFVLLDKSSKACPLPFPNMIKHITGYASSYVFYNENKKAFAQHRKRLLSQPLEKTNPLTKPHVLGKWQKQTLLSLLEQENIKQGIHPTIRSNSPVARVQQYHPTEVFLVEEYIGGTEYSCDYLITKNGKATVLRIVKKYHTPGLHTSFDAFYLFNLQQQQPEEFSLKQLEELCTQCASALGIKQGLCMMDFKAYQNKLYVIETTVRPGISTFVDLMQELYGWTSITYYAKTLFGLPLPSIKQPRSGLVVYLNTPTKGYIKQFSYHQIKSLEYPILKIVPYVQEGSYTLGSPDEIQMHELLGYVMVADVPLKKASDVIQAIKEKVYIQIQPQQQTKKRKGSKKQT